MNYLGYTVAYLDSNGELVDAGQVIDVNMQCDGAYNLNFCYGSFAKVSSDDIIGISHAILKDGLIMIGSYVLMSLQSDAEIINLTPMATNY